MTVQPIICVPMDPVVAVVWDGTIESGEEIVAWLKAQHCCCGAELVRGARPRVQAYDMTDYATVIAPGEVVYIESGCIHSVDRKEFESNFRRVHVPKRLQP